MPNVTDQQLIRAARAGDLSVLKEWKKQNEGVDVHCKDHDGWTPLHHACYNGQLECVKYLIESCEADINCKDSNDWTPLHCACFNDHLEYVKYLIESCESNINCKTKDGWTPLHWACHNGKLKCVEYLIESWGADANCRTNNGWTPLHRACMTSQLECVKYLIESGGADANCKANDGSTSLHWACSEGHSECVEYLIASANADIDIQNNNNKTPLDVIGTNNQINVMRSIIPGLSHRNSELRQQLKENEQENEQLRQQLEQEEEEKKQKAQENEQLQQQLEHQLKRKEEENEHLRQQLGHQLNRKKQENEHKHSSHKRTSISIGEDRLRSFQTENRADIIFLCGQDDQQQPIKANSEVLVVTVPSIQTLISSGISNQCAHDGTEDGAASMQVTVALPNLQPKHVRHVLQCIYTGEISFNNINHDNTDDDDAHQPTPILTGQDDLQQLILVANEFGFWRLKLVLEAELACKYLTEDTMVDALIFAHQHNCVVLKDAAMRMAAESEKDIFTHPDFSKLVPHHQLTGGIHVLRSGGAESDDIDDEYSRMSSIELYKVID